MLRGMMSRSPALGLAAVLALGGCQSGTTRTGGGGDPLRPDLEKICNAMTLSGADQQPPSQRSYVMAQWLNASITSTPGHDFLIEFAQLGEDRAARVKKLEEASARVGLARCPLVDEWR